MAYPIWHPYSSLFPEVLQKYKNPVFIETGTNNGRGIEVALKVGFPVIYSIEIEPQLHYFAKDLYAATPRVNLHLGESSDELRKILSQVKEPCTIFLDAHSIERNPLLDELDVIQITGRKDHTILIDDVRMFGTQDWHGLKKQQALQRLKQINEHYHISYEHTAHAHNDLLVAKP